MLDMSPEHDPYFVAMPADSSRMVGTRSLNEFKARDELVQL